MPAYAKLNPALVQPGIEQLSCEVNVFMVGAVWDRSLLDQLWQSPTHDPLVLLLLRDMALIADDHGRAPLVTLATRFRNFFRKRRAEGKAERAPDEAAHAIPPPTAPGEWTVESWIEIILARALAGLNSQLMHRDGDGLVWNAGLWSHWTPGFRKALRNVAETRLIEYFDSRVQGGW